MSVSDELTVSRDAFVRSLLAAGVAREKAEAEAERRYPKPTVALEVDLDALEKAEQHEVTKVYRAFGCFVRNLSQPRATKQSPGFPDLWVVHHGIGRAWWHETKRQGWTERDVRPAQKVFREDCEVCGVDHVVGDRFAAGDQLVRLGLVTLTAIGTLEPVHCAAPQPQVIPDNSQVTAR